MNEKFKKEIQRLLKKNNLSQRRLSIKANLTHSTVSKIMRGEINPSAATINAIAEVLKVDAAYLMRLAGLLKGKESKDPNIEYTAQRLDLMPKEVQPFVISAINAQIDSVMLMYQEQKKEAIFNEDDPRDELIFKQMLPPLVEAVKQLREEELDDYKELMGRLRIAYDLQKKGRIEY